MAVVFDVPENSRGLAFVMHGLGGFKDSKHIQAMVEVFSKHNFTTVIFDTTNSLNESEGRYEDATMQGYYEDLEDVISWAKDQAWYQVPFLLAGHSMGGFSVANFAEKYPELVKGVFAFAPVVSGELSFKANEKFNPEELKEWKKTGWKTRMSNSRPGAEMRLPWSHMEERLKHDLLPNASKLNMPVLIIVGEKDESCPPEHQKILYEKIPGTRELIIVPGAPHSFKEVEHLEILIKTLSIWLESFK